MFVSLCLTLPFLFCYAMLHFHRAAQKMVQDAKDPMLRACVAGDKAALVKSAATAATATALTALSAVREESSIISLALAINRVYPGMCKTLAHVACEWGHVDVLQWLIEAGADLDVKDKASEVVCD